MKLLIASLLSLYSSLVSAQEITAANYVKVKDSLLHKVLTNTVEEKDKKNLKILTFDFQNRGQTLGEQQEDILTAYKLIDTAILIFTSLKDTYSIANNLKFNGFLLGQSGKFDQAKAEIKKAIDIFTSINKYNGVAVSQFDLSRVFEFENKLDSAVYYTIVPLNYWKLQKDSSRIFILQTALVNLYTKTGELNKADPIQKQVENAANNPKLHWQNLIDFYFVSKQFYKARRDNTLSEHYSELYNKTVGELKQEGIVGRSLFDRNTK